MRGHRELEDQAVKEFSTVLVGKSGSELHFMQAWDKAGVEREPQHSPSGMDTEEGDETEQWHEETAQHMMHFRLAKKEFRRLRSHCKRRKRQQSTRQSCKSSAVLCRAEELSCRAKCEWSPWRRSRWLQN